MLRELCKPLFSKMRHGEAICAVPSAAVFDSNVFLLEQYNTYNIPIQPTHENLLCSNRTQALSVAEKTPVLEADIPNANLRCTVSLPYEFT